MGWDIERVCFEIDLRLDSHGGDKERQHDALQTELRERCREALRPVLSDPKFAEILLWDVGSMLGDEEEKPNADS